MTTLPDGVLTPISIVTSILVVVGFIKLCLWRDKVDYYPAMHLPPPGSSFAKEKGCTRDQKMNQYGHGVWQEFGLYSIDKNCPMHKEFKK